MSTTDQTEIQTDAQMKEMQAENDLLQLHQVQEEQERYYLRNQDLEKNRGTPRKSESTPSSGAVPDEQALAVQAENLRLKARVEVQRQVHHLEKNQSLNAKLGDLLIAAADHPIKMLGLPFKLISLWRRWGSTKPPKSLGEKSFSEVIARYKKGGLTAVEQLLAEHNLSPLIGAQALTALARNLQDSNRTAAATVARRAFELDPKPYRLKWLAFRVHESGDPIQAEVLLDLLPPETSFSGSESRQVRQIRRESAHARQRQAKQETKFDARRKAHEERLNKLTKERDQQTTLAKSRAQEIQSLTVIQKQLEEKSFNLNHERDQQTTLASTQAQEIQSLIVVQKQLEEKTATLTQRLSQTESDLKNRTQELVSITAVRAGLELEKAVLTARQQEAEKYATERQAQWEALTAAKLATERATLTERLTLAETKLKSRVQELEALKVVKTRLEVEYATRFNDLQQKLGKSQSAEGQLRVRQHQMQEEIVRAEAQICVIKELLLREPAA